MNTEVQDFDPLDTNEDGEVSPREYLLGRIAELKTLDPADLGNWRSLYLARMEALAEEGIEGDGFVYRPEEPAPPAPSDYDAQGFGLEVVNGCFAFEPMIETALRWQESNDRLLEYAANELIRRRYMLPIDRLAADEEFQERYRKNLTCRPHPPMGIIGKSGYFSKPVYGVITANTDRAGRTFYVGTQAIEDHIMPYAGSDQAEIVDIFLQDWDSGAAKYRAVRQALNALAEMDRGNRDPWEGYRPVPPALQWNRQAELELALANPDY